MIDRRFFAALLAFCHGLPGALAVAEEPKTEREGGIIGTGIVGTVTELGSIIVNDQRVTFGADTMAGSVLGGLNAGDLVPGDTVVVVAEQITQDWKAASIERQFALIGPAELRGSDLYVLGTRVDTSNVTLGVSDGDWVAVSGLWKETIVMASKLDIIAPQSMASISGSYMPREGVEGFLVGETRVGGLDLSHVRAGDIITVTGQPEPGGIVAETVRIGLFSGPINGIIAQGYMSTPTPTGLYTILGSGAVSFTDQPQMIDTQTVGIYCISDDPENEGRAIMQAGSTACE